MRTTRIHVARVDEWSRRVEDVIIDGDPDVNVYYTAMPGKEFGVLRLKGPNVNLSYEATGFVLEHVEIPEVTIA